MPIDPNTRPSLWKGKAKQLFPINGRDDGPGGSSGVVLSLDMVWTSYFAVAYTVPLQLGPSQQNLSLQIDTGSSDLWVVSKSCSTSSCSATNGRVYDPSASTPTNKTFSIQYLEGSVSGPIVWDTVQIGGYSITNQALAAASSVSNEPLSYNFDGILGLALPLNSVIQSNIPAQTGNAPDGASLSSNLFTLSPSSRAPSQAFFSLSLARPGSTQIPSLLGIGRHLSQVVANPSLVEYSQVVSEAIGMLYWKTNVQAMSVYVNGKPHPVTLQSLSGAAYPTAVLDSGMPVILTTSQIANGIYGALGLSPASDGQYYVPCATPLNMSITLDGQPELSIHPLDLTNEPSGQSGAQYCIGLIQSADSQLQSNPLIGDMVLGVPFMRNVYTVMAYQQPNADGSFNISVSSGISPTLGLLGLTNATQALEEFHTVRVLNQPLDQGPTSQPSATSNSGKALSVGVEVLLGLVGFFALCLVSFALRCFFARRKWRNQTHASSSSSSSSALSEQLDGDHEPEDKTELGLGLGAMYELARRGSRSSYEKDALTLVLESHARQVSQYTVDSGRTYVEEPTTASGELGLKEYKKDATPPVWGGDTPQHHHQRTPSEHHRVPLLAHHHRRGDSDGSGSEGSDLAEFGMVSVATTTTTMAGIGTAARGSQIDPDLVGPPAHVRMRSDSGGRSVRSTVALRADDDVSGAGSGSGSGGAGAGAGLGLGAGVRAGPRPRSSLGSGLSRRSIQGPRPPRPRTAPDDGERTGVGSSPRSLRGRPEPSGP